MAVQIRLRPVFAWNDYVVVFLFLESVVLFPEMVNLDGHRDLSASALIAQLVRAYG